ncbi:MAG: hypothetical protein ACYDAB_08950 [bacterium]
MAIAAGTLRHFVRRWTTPDAGARLIRYVLPAAAFLALCAVYNAGALREGLGNPDNVSFVIEAQEVLRGNWNLHDWTIINSAWWPIQPAVYAALVLIRGPVGAPPAAAALAWATVVACAVWAAARSFGGWTAFATGAVAFLLVGLPAVDTITPVVGHVATAPFEGLTTAAGLLSLVLFTNAVFRRPEQDEGILLRTGAAVFVAGCAVAGDTLAVATIIVPVLALAALDGFRRGRRGRAAAGAAFAIFALGLSRFLLWVLSVTHGERLLQPVNWISFAPFETFFSRNLPLALQGLIAFYGAYWFGRPVLDLATLYVLVHLAALVFVLYAVGRALLTAGTGAKLDWLTGVLALGFVANLGAYAWSTLPASLYTSRYLLAVLPYGGVVAARAFGEMFQDAGLRKRLMLGGMVAVLAAASLSSFAVWFQDSVYVSPRTKLIRWLVDHHLRYGYAQYSDAAALTVESGGRLSVRPVGQWSDLRVGPIPYSARHWYTEPTTFVVFHDEDATGVSVPAAERTFGRDHGLDTIGPYRVAVWPHIIHVPGP